MIRERTKIGLEAAKRARRKLERRFKLSAEDRCDIVHMIR
jgi:hypothetical protein